MVSLFRWWAVACAAALAAACAGAESTLTVSRTPPEVYARRIAPLLTPLAAVEASRTGFDVGDAEGVTLLSEQIQFRDEDGTLYRVIHFVLHARTASAVSALANTIQRFDQERESIFLIDAATILPDGTRVPVAASGAFIQSPQNQSASSLYTSQAELNVIFGQVAPGAMTETLVLIRENIPVMRHEFALHHSFSAGWPIHLQRLSVDLPAVEWDRIHTTVTGGTLPEPVIEPAGAGRRRLVWKQERIARTLWEEHAPSSEHVRPTVWLTSLASWDSVAKWFYGLAADRSELGPELTAEVDRLTQGLTGEQAIVARLHEAVANDVRYTGLEFGLAGYQPYPCAQVWQRRYGDCKDKANLLRAMLAHKGIRSSLALINTEALGRVQRASPSWQQFNHVILAIGDGTSEWGFCDPSIKHLPAGELGMNDRGRDILIVGESGGVWARTPEAGSDAVRFDLQLKLSSDGELTGWLGVEARGSDAAFYTEYFNGQERHERIRGLQQLAEQFVPGAEVPDAEYTPQTGVTSEMRVRAFLRRPARLVMGEPILFPIAKSWLPELTTVGERRQPYALAPREFAVTATIELPAGLAPVQLPAEFVAPSALTDLRSRWELRGRTLHATFRWKPHAAELAPSDYAPLQKTLRNLTAWFAQPVMVRATGDSAAAAGGATPPETDPLAGFVRMPTGEGQLRLLEEMWPEGRNDVLRRQAIERLLQWFPADAETVFTAQVALLRIDPHFSVRTHAERLQRLVARDGEKVSPGLRGWAQFLAAQWEWQAAKRPSAIEQMRQLAADTTLPVLRRSWAAYELARYTGETKPKEAAATLAPWADTAGEAQIETVALLASLYFCANDVTALGKLCEERLSRLGDPTAAWERTLAALQDHWLQASPGTRERTLAHLERMLDRSETGAGVRRRLTNLKATASAGELQKTATRELSAWLKANPPKWWTKKKDPALTNAMQAWDRIRETTNRRETGASLDATLQLLLHHGVEFDEFVRALGLAAWRIHYDEARAEEPLFEQLSRLGLRLPPAASSSVLSLWTTLAKHRAALGREAEAREVLERVERSEFATPQQRLEALGELATLEWRVGDIGAARTAFQALRQLPVRNIDFLFAACLMEHEQGNLDAVADWAHELARSTPGEVAESANAPAIETLARVLRDNPEGLKQYWAHTAGWRSDWRKFVAAVAPDRASWSELPLGIDWAAHEAKITRVNTGREVPAHVRLLNREVRVLYVVPAGALTFLTHVGQFAAPVSQRRQLLECALKLVEKIAKVGPDFDETAELWECILLTETDRREDGVRKAREMFERLGPESGGGQSALRIWAAGCRTDPGRRAAAAAIEKLLAGETAVVRRTDTVATLVDLLTALKDTPRITALLERETARPDFERGADNAKPLVARLAQLRGDPADPSRFSNYVKTWSAAPELAWLKQLAPASLTDPRFASIREPMLESQTGFTDAERLKFNLLLALDERQSLTRREAAFCEVLWDSAFATNDYEALTARLRAALQQPALSAPAKSTLVQHAIRVAVSRRNLELLTAVKSTAAYTTIPEKLRSSAELSWTALDLMQVSAEFGPKKAFQTLLEKPLDAMRQNLAQSILQELVLRGRAAEADALLAATQQVAADPASGLSAPNLRLNWTRAVRTAKEVAPFLTAFHEALLTYPGARDGLSGIAQRQIDLRTPLLLTEAENIALAAHRLGTRIGLPGNLGPMLVSLRRNRDMHNVKPSLAVRLVPRLVEGPMPDALRAGIFRELTRLADEDDPAERAVLEAAIAKLTEPAAALAQPLSAEAAGMLRAILAVRTSTEERPAALFDPALVRGLPPEHLKVMQLTFHVSRGLDAAALATFDEIQSESLSGPRIHALTRHVLARSNRTDELALHEEAVREKFNRNLGMLWLHPGRGDGWQDAFGGDYEGQFKLTVPDAWFEHALSVTRSGFARAQLQFHRARQLENWKDALQACDALIQQEPRLYDLYRDRAFVLWKLGQPGKARADLEVFLKYCRDSSDYPRALQLARELEAAKP